MLTPEEVLRLDSCLAIIRPEVKQDLYVSDDINPRTILWLAEKLKEVNDNLKTVNCSCPRTTLGTPPALHECPKCGFEGGYDSVHYKCAGCAYNKREDHIHIDFKNDISDRWYPR